MSRSIVAAVVSTALVVAAAEAYVDIDEPSSEASATYSETEDGYQYVVALYPPYVDGAVEPPYDATAQSKYCAAADDWARRTYQATEGKHRILRVHFYHADVALPGLAGVQVIWYRQNGGPHVEIQAGAAGPFIYMYDNIKGCKPDWQVIDGMLENTGQFCDVPGGECIDDGGPLGRLFCAVDGVPVERPATDWGWVLAHEGAHWFYGLGDEYFNAFADPYPNFKVCVGDPQTNQGTDETSMMAEWYRDHWCDDVTHLQELVFDGVHVDNPVDVSMWTTVVEHWPELDGHVHGTYPDVDPDSRPPVQCVFHIEAPNDALLVLDRSGSMEYEDEATGQTALQQAVEAALGVYNTTLIDESSGVLAFNHEVATLVPYEPFDGTTLDSIDVSPEGSTDICTAITTAAEMVRAAHPDEAHGAVLLLSDGLPTVPGCSADEDVLDAAWEACFGGEYPVSVNTLGFGDLDAELLDDVATLCNGDVYAMGQDSANLLPPPHELKIDISAAASAVRDRARLLLERRAFVPPQQTESFDCPAGAASLEMVWLGNGHPVCDLAMMNFELVAPSGTIHSANVESPVGTDEIAYHSRSVRIANPEPGAWTSRASELGPSFVCGGARFGWLAHVDHRDLRATAAAAPRVSPRNRPVTLTTVLEYPRPNRGTPIAVEATVVRRGGSMSVEMKDDGSGADEEAADGVYTAVFNAEGFLLPSGLYTLRARLAATEGVSLSVASPPGCIETGATADAPLRGTASVEVDTVFVYRDCCDPEVVPPSPSQQCPAAEACGDDLTPNFEVLTAGTSYPRLSLTLVGQRIGTNGVHVGLGPGVEVSNVTSALDPTGLRTDIEFDAVVALDAPDGQRNLALRWGHKRFAKETAFDVASDPAGAVPDGDQVPGLPLLLARAPGGNLRLRWGASCASTDVDYAVYEGQLDNFQSHVPRSCSTGGATFANFAPAAGDRYYLVVPQSMNREGSYGLDGAGRERSPSAAACRVQNTGACALP